jgi:hypothetical protein
MSDMDERCCGADVCIIDVNGRCWCGQVWNGKKMEMPREDLGQSADAVSPDAKTRESLNSIDASNTTADLD